MALAVLALVTAAVLGYLAWRKESREAGRRRGQNAQSPVWPVSGGVLLDGHRNIDQHVRVFTELRAIAPLPDKSARLLRRLAGG